MAGDVGGGAPLDRNPRGYLPFLLFLLTTDFPVHGDTAEVPGAADSTRLCAHRFLLPAAP